MKDKGRYKRGDGRKERRERRLKSKGWEKKVMQCYRMERAIPGELADTTGEQINQANTWQTAGKQTHLSTSYLAPVITMPVLLPTLP